MVSAFVGNKAETKTMLPVIEVFMAAHDLPDVTVRPQPESDSSRSRDARSGGLSGRGGAAGPRTAGGEPAQPAARGHGEPAHMPGG